MSELVLRVDLQLPHDYGIVARVNFISIADEDWRVPGPVVNTGVDLEVGENWKWVRSE